MLTEKRLHNSHKKNFVRWIAKNRVFLVKNQHFPQNERLRFHKNWFQTKKAMSPKKYSVCLVSISQRVISIMRQIRNFKIRNFVLEMNFLPKLHKTRPV